ncbi:G-protein coupled receptor 35-like [Varanus komodoensis]|uniref:G-protein coupled receptor 35-like n=1 Tax=Varanus komodoensis TaxID=61221 RepID=UPI001CF7B347|nr:G-protein coupled receptor 35-like [Varanus komodoensis]
MPMSISNIALIALDRYIAIKHPLKARVIRSPEKAAIIRLAQYALGRFGTDCKMHQTIVKATQETLFLTNLNCCLDAICHYLVAKEFQEAASALAYAPRSLSHSRHATLGLRIRWKTITTHASDDSGLLNTLDGCVHNIYAYS